MLASTILTTGKVKHLVQGSIDVEESRDNEAGTGVATGREQA